MASNTTEQALEATIEKALTGTCREELKEQPTAVAERAAPYHTGNGYTMGNPSDFSAQYALDEHYFWQFLQRSQPDELAKLQRHSDWRRKIVERLDRMLKKYGILHVLRLGLDVDDAHFTLFYQLPLASSSPAVHQNFAHNEFSATRQVRYSVQNPQEEIDMVLFINGLPIATMELKNHWTGQNAKFHGQKQYKEQRDPKQPLLNFGRCIVHFAVDTEEVYMTTKLEGRDTFFLPFNKGNNNGKGNPRNPNGHRTAYLWEEVLAPRSVANILQHFVRLGGKSTEPLNKRTLFFPRYHQLEVVRRLVAHASNNGVGHKYLIQHSAGSGKSNSITWAAYQLIETYPANDAVPGGKGVHSPLFDSVIVVTDRTLLDKQLRENIREFSQVKNIVAPAHSARELKEHLEQGKKIIITTIQKFPVIVDGIADLSHKQFAVLIDEAHSSQGGTASGTMNRAMGRNNEDEEEEDVQDKILAAMRSRKMRGNASYLAFTATPKNTTLEKFGVPQQDGSFRPFHLYSMKQAIEEGFILDVLANYTTYRSYYEIAKSIEENPLFETVKAQKKLRAYVERHEQTIAAKADIMLEHFLANVVRTKKLKGKAKAIVATQNIESAIRYYKAISHMLEEKGKPFKVLIAFSGKKTVDGIEYTEADINGFSEQHTRDKFNEDDYRILVVANKYLTGFDQPKLTTMYIDKKLQGVLAVQALSRLNRAADALGKRTEDLFVLDFFNSVDDIQAAFTPFYTSTTLRGATDVNVLHELKTSLDTVGVYEWHEVEEFASKYFAGVQADLLSPIIALAAERFTRGLSLDTKEQADCKIKAKQFVKIYGQIAAILSFENVEWEKLFWFLKFLIPHLPIVDPTSDAMDDLLDSVDLSTYGLQRVKLSHSIALDDAETELKPQNPNPRGVPDGEREKDPLDAIIKNFNDRWFHGWGAAPEEQRVKLVTTSHNIRTHPDFQTKVANNPDKQNREIALKTIVDEVMIQQRRTDMEMYRLYKQGDAFYQDMLDVIKRMLEL